MAKLTYDNIFESVIKDKKKAIAMQTASHVLIDLDEVLRMIGTDEDARRQLIDVVQRHHFRRYE